MTIRRLKKDDVAFTKRLALLNAAVPAAMLLLDFATGRTGPNPLEYATHVTGTVALVFLVLSLAVTPLRRVSGLEWLAQHRRALGLWAFGYAVAHLVCYWWFDKQWNVVDVAIDVLKRPFVAVGMATVALMVPLALTSTNGMIRRLGGKRWRALHRFAYLAGAGGALHYYMLVKADVRLPLAFAAALAVLLGFRAVDALRRRAAAPPSPSRAR